MLPSAGYAAGVLESHHKSTVSRTAVAVRRVSGVAVHGGIVQTNPTYTTVEAVARTIRRVGAEHCIISSDIGSPQACPPETTRAYLYSLGISDDQLRRILASCYPFCSLGEYVDRFTRLPFREPALEKLLRKNAATLLELNLQPQSVPRER